MLSEYNSLEQRIRDKKVTIAVVGLGYVGLTLAMHFTAAGFMVLGLDTDEERVNQVNRGEWPLDPSEPVLPTILRSKKLAGVTINLPWASTDPFILTYADVIIIAVPTPALKGGQIFRSTGGTTWTFSADPGNLGADLSMLSAAMNAVAEFMGPYSLLIIASTVSPKTTMAHLPLLEKSMKHGEHFWVAHCPERLTAGRLWENVANLPHVIGGVTAEAGQMAALLYGQICRGELLCTDVLSAEISKVAENAYRDVQVGFVNALAMMCHELGADIWKVRELINSCPGRGLLKPGPGVGGACLIKDTWLLLASHEPSLWDADKLLAAARVVNDMMPLHVVYDLVVPAMEEGGIGFDRNAVGKVVLLGASYREGTGDTRNAPATMVKRHLRALGLEVVQHDPHIPEHSGSIERMVEGADCAIIAVAHEQYRGLDWQSLGMGMAHRILIDACGITHPPVGFIYRQLGVGTEEEQDAG